MAQPSPLVQAIMGTAQRLGINPLDLATTMSYETAGTFDPWKRGPTTQWGQHRGLIQWGEPQRQKYGVYQGMPVDQQVAKAGEYLRDAGVKPGMGLLDIYSAVNAGHVGRYNASDANNGGAPGTVRDKVTQQMAGHKANAERLLAGLFTPLDQQGPSPGMAAATTAAVQDGQRYNTAAPDVAGIADRIKQAQTEANALTPKPAYGGAMAMGGMQPGAPEAPYSPDMQDQPLQLRPVALPDASPELGTLGQLLAAQKANLVQAAQVGAQPVDPRAPVRPTGLSALFAPPPAV